MGSRSHQRKYQRRRDQRRTERETWASKSGPVKIRFVDPRELRK